MMRLEVAFASALPVHLPGLTSADQCKAKRKYQPLLALNRGTFEPSYTTPLPKNFPESLLATTVYHNVPSNPQHHVNPDTESLAHTNDGDGYVVAISFPPDSASEIWIRGRFVRTKPYYVESRLQKRVFRGSYGTPGATGLSAPTKPKPSCAKGVATWTTRNERIIAYGIRSLPLAMNLDTLVTRGPTALGAVLTDSEELISERATELSLNPARLGELTVTVGISRSPQGKVIGAFVCELGVNYEVVKRYNMIPVPSGCDVVGMTLCEEFCLVAMHRAKEESAGLLSVVFGTGKKKGSPIVDKEFGTHIAIISRASGNMSTCRIPNTLLTHLCSSTVANSSLNIGAIEFSYAKNEVVRMSTLADSRSGELWLSNMNNDKFSSGTVRITFGFHEQESKFDTTLESVKRDEFGENLIILNAVSATAHDLVCTVSDTTKKQIGVAILNRADLTTSQLWLSGQEMSLSGMAVSPDGKYFSVLCSLGHNRDITELLIFQTDLINDGPIETIHLDPEEFGHIGPSVGAVWTNHLSVWSTNADKPAKSSYEIFFSRNWNDIESGFSSLGV